MVQARPISNLREVLALVWSQSSAFVKLRFTVSLLLVLVSGALAPLGPIALKLIVDSFTGHASPEAATITVLAGLYVLSQWLSRSIGELRGLAYSRAERRMFRVLSERLFGHVMRLPLRFHLERKTGVITQTLENGLQGYQRIVNQVVFTLLPVAVQLLTIAIVLLRFDQPAFLVIFCSAVLCYGIAFTRFARRVSVMAKSASAARIDANGVMTDGIINYETVKLFAAEETVQDKVSRALIDTEDRWGSFYRLSATNGLAVATLYAGFLGLAIGYAVYEVGRGRMTVGDFVLVNTYMLQVMQPVEQLGRAVQSVAQGLAMLDKMLALFRERTEPRGEGEWRAAKGARRLEFERVSVSYRSDRPILRDLSFVLEPGRTLGIVGASGAGKSTLVRLLVRLIEPDQGRILFDGIPLPDLPLAALRRAIAVVPQDTVLFDEDIGYNIGFGRPDCSQAQIEAAAGVANLHRFVSALPDGYRTRVGERGLKLSGGEKQRVSIARAALKQPQVYVFDEATSSLDSITEREILRNLRELSRDATTLVIAHRLSTVVHADEIAVLHEGTIVERGSHAQLLALRGHYAELWRSQQAAADVIDSPAAQSCVSKPSATVAVANPASG